MNELVSARPDTGSSRAARFRGGMITAFRLALDFALPPLCPSCREPLNERMGLCASCWSKLSLIEPPYCARLGIPFGHDPGPGLLSMEAIANPPAYDRARAAVRYDDVARKLVQGFKYSDRLELAPMMGQWMARAGRELLAEADVLTPVPLHWRRQWARRFNQRPRLPARSRPSVLCRLHTVRSNVCGPRRSRSDCQKPSGLTMSKAPSACQPNTGPISLDGVWC